MRVGGQLGQVVKTWRLVVKNMRASAARWCRKPSTGTLRGCQSAKGNDLAAQAREEVGGPPIRGMDDVMSRDVAARCLDDVKGCGGGGWCDFGAWCVREDIESARINKASQVQRGLRLLIWMKV